MRVLHPSLSLNPSPAYELLLELSVASAPDELELHRADSPWLNDVLPTVPADLLAEVQRFTAGCDKLFPHLILLAHDCPAPRDADHLIAYLNGLEPMQIYLAFLGYHLRYFRRATPAEIIRAAAEGDAEARKQLLKTSYPDDARWQAALRRLLDLGPDSTKSETLALLRRWNAEVFSRHEAEVMPILERDAEAKRAMLLEASPEAVIAAATGGIEYAPEPGISQVLLIPSYAARPWTHALDRAELKIFCYGVADESLTASRDDPPLRLARLTRALGDERRLRILRLLAGGRYALPEIAERFGVPKTTMHHHLLILRSAGLVRMRSSDRTYVLQEDALPRVSEMLVDYLKGDRP